MLARVAENLYWLGRYIERAENQARLIDVERQTGTVRAYGGGDPWEFVLDTLGAESAFRTARETDPGLTGEQYLVYSAQSPFSIRTSVTSARTLAMELREHSSREVFEAINRLFHSVNAAANGATDLGSMLQQIRNSVATVFGLFENTVLHSEGVHWFRFGHLLERADMTSRIVDAKYFINLPSTSEVGGPVDRHQWRGVLRSTSALEAYHKTFLGSIRVDRVIDLLFLNPVFPRSLLYCINSMRDEFALATVKTPPAWTLRGARELVVTQLEFQATTGRQIVAQGLHEFIDSFQETLIRIDRGLTDNLFRAVETGDAAGDPATPLVKTSSLQAN